MAIIFSKNSGLNDELWKPVGQVLTSVMQDTDTEQSDYDGFVKSAFCVSKSTKYAEKQGSMTEFSDFAPVNEGDTFPADDIQQGMSKLIIHDAFAKKFICTREMRDDNNIETMKIAAANFVRSAKRSRAQFASSALTSQGTTFLYGGKKYDRTTGDGKALFATDHPGVKGGVSAQSNVFTNAFGTDATMLYRLANIGRNFKNQSGIVEGYNFDTIVIPSDQPALEDLILRIIHSSQIVGSGNNDVNTQKDRWKLVVDPLWQSGSAAPYIIMSSKANTQKQGSKLYDRVPLDMKNWIDNETENLCWSGYQRTGVGFNDWRHLIMGGATTGSTLT